MAHINDQVCIELRKLKPNWEVFHEEFLSAVFVKRNSEQWVFGGRNVGAETWGGNTEDGRECVDCEVPSDSTDAELIANAIVDSLDERELHIDENGVLTCGCGVSGFFVEVENGVVSDLTCTSCESTYKAKNLPSR